MGGWWVGVLTPVAEAEHGRDDADDSYNSDGCQRNVLRRDKQDDVRAREADREADENIRHKLSLGERPEHVSETWLLEHKL